VIGADVLKGVLPLPAAAPDDPSRSNRHRAMLLPTATRNIGLESDHGACGVDLQALPIYLPNIIDQ
jgi:hypothetical protein